MTPEAFAVRITEWGRGSMIGSQGPRFVSAGQGRAVAQLAFKPDLTQLTRVFHAGAIIALADETATAAAMWETNPTREFRPELFPSTLHMSANLIRNTDRSTLVAEVENVRRRRSLAAAPPAGAAPAGPRGR